MSSLKSVESRFWVKVDKNGEYPGNKGKWGLETNCWIWLASKLIGKGYARFEGGYAHRYSYVLHFGEISEGKIVMHKCDNPECTNPEHLYLGTQSENVIDMFEKGRKKIHGRQVSPPSGEKNPVAKLTDAIVLEGRRLHKAGMRIREIFKLKNVPGTLRNFRKAVKGISWRHLDHA